MLIYWYCERMGLGVDFLCGGVRGGKREALDKVKMEKNLEWVL